MVDDLTGQPLWSELSDHDRRLEVGLHAGGRIAELSFESTRPLMDRYGNPGFDVLDEMFARSADAIDDLCDRLFRSHVHGYAWLAFTRTADDRLGTAYAGELLDRIATVTGLLRAEPDLWHWTGVSTYLRRSDTLEDVVVRTRFHGPGHWVWSGWKQLRP